MMNILMIAYSFPLIKLSVHSLFWNLNTGSCRKFFIDLALWFRNFKNFVVTTYKHYMQTVRWLTHRFRPPHNFMQYRQLKIPDREFYSDTMSSKIKSVQRYTCEEIYGNKFGYIKAYPINWNDKQNIGGSLLLIIQDMVVMQKLYTDISVLKPKYRIMPEIFHRFGIVV